MRLQLLRCLSVMSYIFLPRKTSLDPAFPADRRFPDRHGPTVIERKTAQAPPWPDQLRTPDAWLRPEGTDDVPPVRLCCSQRDYLHCSLMENPLDESPP
jgi:hypothetical protein